MSETFIESCAGGATNARKRRLTDWLGLAAAPTFAVMGLFTGVVDNNASHAFCETHGASPLSGMALMYWLMSVFHAAPWLKLISNRGRPPSKEMR
jgi:hypothetical protein